MGLIHPSDQLFLLAYLFTTPREINKFELISDIKEFGRRMKCKVYFDQTGEKENMDFDKVTRFKVKSLWTPDIDNPTLDLFLKNLEELFR